MVERKEAEALVKTRLKPPLPKKELLEHFEKLRAAEKKGEEEEAARLRNLIVEHNMRFVVRMANGMANRGLPLEDMIQDGNIGLITAVDKFDHTRGNSFITHAAWWIRQAIEKGLQKDARQIRLPSYVEDELRRFEKTRKKLTTRLERLPTQEEVMEALKWGPKRIERIKRAVNLMYMYELDRPLITGETPEKTFVAFVKANNEGTAAKTKRREQREALFAALDILKPRARRILCLRYGILKTREKTKPLPLRDIAALFGLSRERIRQIQEESLKKLRESGDPRLLALREYLE